MKERPQGWARTDNDRLPPWEAYEALYDFARRLADHERAYDEMHDESWFHARALLVEEAEHAGLLDTAGSQSPDARSGEQRD